MAKTNGRLIVCDRCGETVFCKCTGEGERDGFFTRWNEFEEANGWYAEYGIGDLCPECSAEWETVKSYFARKRSEFLSCGERKE